MKITTEVEISLSAKAVYRDGKVKLSVNASIPYANREAAGSVKGASEEVVEMFAHAFETLIAEQQDKVVKVAQAAQAESMTVAARMQEL